MKTRQASRKNKDEMEICCRKNEGKNLIEREHADLNCW
jgi:hypothetical protein